MTIKLVQKDICLMDGSKIKVDIRIPLRYDSVLDEEQDEWVKEMMVNQVIRGIKESIDAYKASELPNKFLYPQTYVITNESPYLGTFISGCDDIILDADGISDIRRVKNSFILGNQMGYKIDKYTDTTDAYASIASSFGMNVQDNEDFLREMYTNICGLIVSGDNATPLAPLEGNSLPEELSEGHTNHLKRQVLRNIYHV